MSLSGPAWAVLANVTGLAEVPGRLSFNRQSLRTTHLIRLDTALRGCRGHTIQPRGQAANYTSLCLLSLSPPQRCGRQGEKEPEKEVKKLEYRLRYQKVKIENN